MEKKNASFWFVKDWLCCAPVLKLILVRGEGEGDAFCVGSVQYRVKKMGLGLVLIIGFWLGLVLVLIIGWVSGSIIHNNNTQHTTTNTNTPNTIFFGTKKCFSFIRMNFWCASFTGLKKKKSTALLINSPPGILFYVFQLLVHITNQTSFVSSVTGHGEQTEWCGWCVPVR